MLAEPSVISMDSASKLTMDPPSSQPTDDVYEFRYVPVKQFERVIKSVQDNHKLRDQNSRWNNFFAAQHQSDAIPEHPANTLSDSGVPTYTDQYIDNLINDAYGEVIGEIPAIASTSATETTVPLIDEPDEPHEPTPKPTKQVKKKKVVKKKSKMTNEVVDYIREDKENPNDARVNEIFSNTEPESVEAKTIEEELFGPKIVKVWQERNLSARNRNPSDHILEANLIAEKTLSARQRSMENVEAAIILTKITTYQEKMCLTMHAIGDKVIEASNNLCASFDAKRFQKRFSEFIIRFNRNYLYPIGRTMDEIKVYKSTDASTPLSKQQLNQKVCGLFSMLLQACQSFERNLAGDIGLDKLHIFLDTVVDALHVCLQNRIFEETDLLMKRLLVKTTTVMDCIDDRICIERTAMLKHKQKAIRNVPKFTPSNTKYSMYGSTNMTLPKYTVKVPPKHKSRLGSTRNNEIRVSGKKSHQKMSVSQSAMPTNDRSSKLSNAKLSHSEVRTVVGDTDWNEPIDQIHGLSTSSSSLCEPPDRSCAEADENRPVSVAPDLGDTHKCLLDALQSITQQHIRQILAPLMEQLTYHKNPESVQRQVAALYASVCPATERDAGCSKTVGECSGSVANVDAAAHHEVVLPPISGRDIGRLANPNHPNNVDGGVATAVAALNDAANMTAGDDESVSGFRLEMRSRACVDPQVAASAGAPPADAVVTPSAVRSKSGPVTNIRYCRNVQHTYVTESERPASTSAASVESNIGDSIKYTPAELRKKSEADALARAGEHRKRFIRSVARNSLYQNNNFNCDPWTLISRVADDTVRNAISEVEAEFDFGEEEIVNAFIQANRNVIKQIN